MRVHLFFILLSLFSFAYAAKFFHFSDIHLDFQYNGKVSSDDRCHGPDDPQTKYNAVFGRYYCDCPQLLLTDTLQAMQRVEPHPDFLIFSGDMASHFPRKKQVAAFIKEVTNQIQAHFPQAPLFATPGNDDFPDNYIAKCNDPWYKTLHEIWAPWIPEPQKSNFYKGGYYSAVIQPRRSNRPVKIISINTILYSRKDEETEQNPDPCDQFQFLRHELHDAYQNDMPVYIVSHIAPGGNAYSQRATFHPEHFKKYAAIIREYPPAGQFFGHFHMDEFRVIYENDPVTPGQSMGRPQSAIMLAPSVTPYNGNNPGFRLLTSNTTHALLDYTQYYFDLRNANTRGYTEWTPAYTFTEAYHLPDLSPQTYHTLVNQLKGNAELYDLYSTFRTNLFSPNRHSYLCAIQHINPDVFMKCSDEKASDGLGCGDEL